LEAYQKELYSPGDTNTSHHGTLHVPSFAAEINDAFGPMAKTRDIRFRYTLDLDPATEYLRLDRLKLEKTLPNLLINAFNKKQWMAQLLRLIEDNLQDEQMNIPSLSDKMSVSKCQLFRNVNETTGLSPNQLIQEIRLAKAYQLLQKQTKLSVADIAYSVGMANPSYFTTAFKKRFNKSPLEFKS
jgi:AraC-like DNA-binding protein